MERGFVPALPRLTTFPDLTPYAENGLGVTAFDGDIMLGFLCSVPPFQNAFGSTDATGIFSPMGANGAIGEHPAKIYARMYQAAAEKWVRAGATSHAVSLYAHDDEAQRQFFRYGFGIRCVDAIRDLDEVDSALCENYEFAELPSDEHLQVLPLVHLLDAHMAARPTFIVRPSDTPESFLRKSERSQSTYLVAKFRDQVVAYLKAELGGETFIRNVPGYMHINGAYCLPEHRGRGLPQQLLQLLVNKLRTQRCTHLGVDFESINPAAYGFWLKHFAAYTCVVARRIDENALTIR
ncbi:MAG TPA: GNAT family N-acetyltransferase [Nitrolancea sp.]